MNLAPVLPVWFLGAAAAVVVVMRLLTLYRLLESTPSGRYRAVVLRWSGLTLAALLLVLAAFRPGLDEGGSRPAAESSSTISDLNIFLVVDRSVTVRVADYGDDEPRMTGIRADIGELIEKYRDARFELIGFAGKANIDWPLSQDRWSFRAYANALSAYTLAPTDAIGIVDPAAAHEVLREQLERARERYPKSRNVVFYFGDGVSGPGVQTAEFEIPDGLISAGAVLGYGTPAGGPIPAAYADGRKLYYRDRATGTFITAPLDEQRLRAIAGQMEVPYYHRQAGDGITAVLPPISSTYMSDVVRAGTVDPLYGRTDWYWILASLAAALFLVEITLTVREYRRNRLSRTDFTVEEMQR